MPIQRKKVLQKEHARQKTLVEKIKHYFKEQEQKIVSDKKKQFAFFILGFVLFYMVLSTAILFVPPETYKTITGGTVQALLSFQGVKTVGGGLTECTEANWLGMETKSNCYSFGVEGKTIIISWLCTGILEIIILVSAILSSFGINWRKKIFGAFAAIIAGIIFNLLRIWVTVNIVLTQNIQVVELAHDFLFKIVLFIYITGFYIAWFYWAMRKK